MKMYGSVDPEAIFTFKLYVWPAFNAVPKVKVVVLPAELAPMAAPDVGVRGVPVTAGMVRLDTVSGDPPEFMKTTVNVVSEALTDTMCALAAWVAVSTMPKTHDPSAITTTRDIARSMTVAIAGLMAFLFLCVILSAQICSIVELLNYI